MLKHSPLRLFGLLSSKGHSLRPLFFLKLVILPLDFQRLGLIRSNFKMDDFRPLFFNKGNFKLPNLLLFDFRSTAAVPGLVETKHLSRKA